MLGAPFAVLQKHSRWLPRLEREGELGPVPTSFYVVAAVVALILRVGGAQGELWLDEIWSLELAQQVRVPGDLFFGLRHDNHHLLNTAWLVCIGPGQPFLVYRLPAILAGTLAVVLGGRLAARWGNVEAVTTTTLLATSSVLVHYSSEARGYAFVLLFALGGLACLFRFADRPWWGWAVLFWLCTVLGFASHPVFVPFWIATLYWSVVARREVSNVIDRSAALAASRLESPFSWSRIRASWALPSHIQHAVICHSVPSIAVGLFYWLHWQGVELGGGPQYGLSEVLMQAASRTLGGPAHGPLMWIAGMACGMAVAWGIWRMRADETGVLVGMGILLPVAQVVVARPPFLFIRYFLLAMLLATLALAVALGSLYRAGRRGKYAYAVVLPAVLLAHLGHTVELARLGRGSCIEALAYLARETDEPVVSISSDHDFGIGKLVEFYGSYADPGRPFAYMKGQEWTDLGPRWVVFHREGRSPLPLPPALLTFEGHAFRRTRVFDCAPLSGWQWVCYRRDD